MHTFQHLKRWFLIQNFFNSGGLFLSSLFLSSFHRLMPTSPRDLVLGLANLSVPSSSSSSSLSSWKIKQTFNYRQFWSPDKSGFQNWNFRQVRMSKIQTCLKSELVFDRFSDTQSVWNLKIWKPNYNSCLLQPSIW